MSAVSTNVQRSSLTEIIQANAIGANTCRVLATTPSGRGVIFIADGEVVDAGYGNLSGEDAFYALINAEVSQTQVSTGLRTPNRRITSGWQALITRAMTLRFDGRLPVPSFPDDKRETEATTVLSRDPDAAPRPAPRAAETAKAAPAARPRPVAAVPPAPARRKSPVVPIAAGLVVALAVAGGAALLRGGRRSSAAPPAVGTSQASTEASPAAPAPVEASELKGTGDALPALLAGVAPLSPNPESALVPTIVCRLLIAEDGSVKEASIFRSRLDQASFEDAALSTVKGYRFKPGQRGGKPVAVWINWPVSFQ